MQFRWPIANGAIIAALIATGCGPSKSAVTGPPKVEKPPWTVIKEVSPDSFDPTSCLVISPAHNCVRVHGATNGTAQFKDLQTGEVAFGLSFHTEQNSEDHQISLVSGDFRQRTPHIENWPCAVIMGEGNWAFVWGAMGGGFGSISSSKAPVMVETALPGLGLDTFSTTDGGFISIRAKVDSEYGKVVAYHLSVYRLKDGKCVELTAAPETNPYWRWVGATIPQPPNVQGEDLGNGSMPAGAPGVFTEGGLALTGYYADSDMAQLNGPLQLWSLATRSWERVEVPGHKDHPEGFKNAVSEGDRLFVERQTGETPELWTKQAGGPWTDLGAYFMLARGADHLVVKSASDPAAKTMLVTVTEPSPSIPAGSRTRS